MDYNETIKGVEYDFLRSNPHLGKRLCYLTVAGSRAYGTNNEGSDLDLRGFAIERPAEVFGTAEFEQVDDDGTDTVIYSLRKFVHLCAQCNPNVIEMLGTNPEHVLICDDIGRLIRDNAHLFLSKRAYYTFTGYATAQLRRLENALARDSYPQAEKMAHIKRSLDQMMMTLRGQYQVEGGAITFTLRDSGNGEKELCTSVHIDNMPLSRFHAINRDIGTMLRNYGKLNNRNHKKDVPHLRKHAMHLIRLFLMGLDILEGRGINTFRADEQEMLLAIRSGDIPIEEVFCMNEEYEKKLKLAYEESVLPDLPNNDAINDLLEKCYRIGYESGKFA